MSKPLVVLVTGCTTGGMGFHFAEEYAREGCKVYATARNVDAMKGFSGTNIYRRKVDVTSSEDIDAVVEEIMENEGRIDIVVNNAGVIGISPIVDLDLDKVQRTFDANTFSLIRMAKAVVPHMAKARSGLIVNIGSVVGNLASPWNGLYAATKAAQHSLSDNLAMELSPFNIRVMLVAPGGVKSNIASNAAAEFNLPKDSLYVPWLDNIIARMWLSQGPRSWPADRFAKHIVAQTLRKSPPRYISVGAWTTVYKILAWLPRSLALWVLWRNSGKLKKA